MSIQPTKLKSAILNTGKKVGLLVAEDGPADKAITRGSDLAANVINEGEKQGKKLVHEARSVLDELRAKVHAATAPKPAPAPEPAPSPAPEPAAEAAPAPEAAPQETPKEP